jgi:hypothetical protein
MSQRELLPAYEKLSKEDFQRACSSVRRLIEYGHVGPGLKPFFLPIDGDQFAYSHHSGEYPLPEFVSISMNILDCFATAVISAPTLHFPPIPLSVRCWLSDRDDRLTLHLEGTLTATEQIRPVEMTEDSAVWVASHLRALAEVKDIAPGDICWDRSMPDSSFWFDYPGRLVRHKVPWLGELGKDGKAQWPECELMMGVIDEPMRERARQAIGFVEMDDDGIVLVQ